MKKIFSYSVTLLTAVAALVSCTKDYDYDPAAPFSEEGVKVSFVQEDVVLGDLDKEFEVTVTRTETEGELTIPIVVEAAADVFSVPQSVTFADGEEEATFVVTVTGEMEYYTGYELRLTTSAELLDPYTEDQETFYRFATSVTREDFKPVAAGVFTDNLYTGEQWETELEYSEVLNLYRLPSLFVDGYHIVFSWEKGEQTAVVCDLSGAKQANTPLGFTFYSYGMVYWNAQGNTVYDADEDAFYFPAIMRVSAGSLTDLGWEIFQVAEWY